MSGASVCPIKMFAAATMDSPAVVPTTLPMNQPNKKGRNYKWAVCLFFLCESELVFLACFH